MTAKKATNLGSTRERMIHTCLCNAATRILHKKTLSLRLITSHSQAIQHLHSLQARSPHHPPILNLGWGDVHMRQGLKRISSTQKWFSRLFHVCCAFLVCGVKAWCLVGRSYAVWDIVFERLDFAARSSGFLGLRKKVTGEAFVISSILI